MHPYMCTYTLRFIYTLGCYHQHTYVCTLMHNCVVHIIHTCVRTYLHMYVCLCISCTFVVCLVDRLRPKPNECILGCLHTCSCGRVHRWTWLVLPSWLLIQSVWSPSGDPKWMGARSANDFTLLYFNWHAVHTEYVLPPFGKIRT